MNTCNTEFVRGIVVQGAGIAGIGTAVDIDSLFSDSNVVEFNEITVFNDGSDIIKAQWTNSGTAAQEDFMVPAGGKSFTRILNRGGIVSTSLKIYAASDSVAVSGNITINLGKH